MATTASAMSSGKPFRTVLYGFSAMLTLSVLGCADLADRSGRMPQVETTAQGVFSDTAVLQQLGTADIATDSSATIGRIRSAKVDGRGNVLVLDELAHTIHWFDADGVHRGAGGRRGSGPGEFRVPAGLAVSSDDRILVLDSFQRRISTYVIAEGALTHVFDRPVPYSASDICTIGERAYILASEVSAQHHVHEIDTEGRVVHSFGHPTPPGSSSGEFGVFAERVASAGRTGRLLCLPDENLVIVVRDESPEVRAYTAAGELTWTSVMSGYSPVRWELLENGRALRRSPERAHYLGGVSEYPGGLIAVSLTERGPWPEPRTDVRLLRRSDGSEVFVGRTDGYGIVAARDSLRYLIMRSPYPAILVSLGVDPMRSR